jgi:diketogulonate reductase-like aldo/keto reductase
MKTVKFPADKQVPALGQGTWQMAESGAGRREAIAALQLGLDLGMTVIDTAEMYGEGAVEEIVGEAIAGRRDEVFLVTKCYPQNASRKRMVEACNRSLKRLRTDRIDLYLLHWPASVPIEETLDTFMRLKDEGRILDYGISNFDARGIQRVWSAPGGGGIVTNQVLHNLSRRGIEWDLLPWCRKRNLPVMAYTPLGQGELLRDPVLATIGARHERHGPETCAPTIAIEAMRHGKDVMVDKPGVISLDDLAAVQACVAETGASSRSAFPSASSSRRSSGAASSSRRARSAVSCRPPASGPHRC